MAPAPITLVYLSICSRFDVDRLRQEVLARDRLHQRRGRRLNLPSCGDLQGAGNKPSLYDLQIMAVQELTWKHAEEREVRKL